MFNKKKIIFFVCILILSVLVYIFAPSVVVYFKWQKVVKAAGAFPYQIGLTNVVTIPCFTTGSPPICTGGTLCYIKDAASCTLYSNVSGTMSGGMGDKALFLKTAIAQSGLTQGGQLIAGGMSPVLMDSGVLASGGGCYGCYASLNVVDKIKNWFDYIIAGIKD